MVQYGTLAWMETLRDRLNDSKEFKRAARGWNASLLYEIGAEGGFEKDTLLGLRVVDGTVIEVWEGEPAETTDYRITAPYGVFVALNKGELNAVKAIVARKLKMKGNPTRLLRDSRPVNALQAVAVGMAKDGTTEFVAG
jgi:putative sterol carrier protein